MLNSLFLESSRSMPHHDMQLIWCVTGTWGETAPGRKIKTSATASWVIPSVALSKEVPGGGRRKPSSSGSGSSQTCFNLFDFSWHSSGVPVDELVCHCPSAASPALPNCAIYLLYLCIGCCHANGPLQSLSPAG